MVDGPISRVLCCTLGIVPLGLGALGPLLKGLLGDMGPYKGHIGVVLGYPS